MDSRFAFPGKILVLRLNRLEYVPSGLYSSELIVERGYPVLALEYGQFQKSLEFENTPIPRLRLGHPWLRWVPRRIRAMVLHTTAAARIAWWCLLHGRPRMFLAEGLHEQTVAYVLSLFLRVPFAVHVHEVFESAEVRGWNRLFQRCEGSVLRQAIFTIFPEHTRAEIYRDRYGLTAPQFIAFNCPRRKTSVSVTDWRSRLGLPADSKLLGYWGGQGRTNALEQAIRAVARLPKVYFLLWGWSSAKDREYFENLATGVGAAHRILFLGELPKEKWAAIAGLDLSYCVYEPKELRLKHLATASNKLMESLSVGVPVISSSEPDFRTLVDFYDIGGCTPDFSVDAITRSLRDLFTDSDGLKRRSTNALRCHREFFHYEHQFQPALKGLDRLLPQAEASARGLRKVPSN